MKRKIIAWTLAVAAAFSLAAPVSAAVTKRGNAAGRYVDANGDGICDYFVDADKDGICDNCSWALGRGAGRGRYFVDKNGDGICDNDTSGTRRGLGCGRGRGASGQGRF